MSKLTLLVISDIHCHTKKEADGKADSFFKADDMRFPSNQNPVQSLLDLIDKDDIRADLILCPGDISHKTSIIGFSHAFSLLNYELRSAVNASHTYCALGNHDVCSRGSDSDPFHQAKNIHLSYPVKEKNVRDMYWSRGFYIVNYKDVADILVINTAWDHYTNQKAKSGTFDSGRIEILQENLSQLVQSGIRIALLHHHPVLHSFANLSSKDVIPNGDQLMKVLSSHGFELIIHGHRHQPKMRRTNDFGIQQHVLSAGSFSAHLQELHTRTRHVFHLIKIEKHEDTNKIKGLIKTWEFGFGNGWKPTSINSSEFPHLQNFGESPPDDLAQRIIKKINDGQDYLDREILIREFPEIDNLLPDEIRVLEKELEYCQMKLDRSIKDIIEGVGKAVGGC